MLGYGLLLVLVARGVLLGRRWSRGPAAATQLILLPIAWSFRASPTTWVAVPSPWRPSAIIVGLLHPRSTEVFVGPLAHPSRTPTQGYSSSSALVSSASCAASASASCLTRLRKFLVRSSLRVEQHVVRRALLDHHALVHEDHPVGHPAGEAHLVGDHDHGGAAPRPGRASR